MELNLSVISLKLLIMRFLFILLIVILQVSCKKENNQENLKQPAAITFTRISYGTDPQQMMDVYLPKNRNIDSTKTIILIHGGAWTGGDKSDMLSVMESLQKRMKGYVFINLNYRLAVNNSVNVFPAQENDVKSAISFYLSKSDEYKVSKDLIVLGASAGAHLALLHSYKNDPERHVKAVVDFFGPTDLTAARNDGILGQLILRAIGKTYNQDPQMYIQSSPVNFITSQSPPTIALHGGKDIIVSPSQSNLLINKLNSLGVPNQLVFYPDDKHGFTALNYADAYNKIQSFILMYVK